MAIPDIMQTGRSGLYAAKVGIATTGHNISNANTEGYSRQRVEQTTDNPRPHGPKAMIGSGTLINRIDRINDGYIEKQIRNTNRELAHFEEKDVVLKQTEDIFNEMGGEGLNRLMSRFFNEFRKLSNDPNSEAIRQAVREAAQALVNDFRRLRKEVSEVGRHIDARLDGQVREINALAGTLKDLNIKIKALSVTGASPNDLLDQRDKVLKQLSSYMDLSMYEDKEGSYVVDIKGVGPLVVGGDVQKFEVARTQADGQGKSEGALDIISKASGRLPLTHQISGGKMGAILEVRDKTLSTILDRLDELAYGVTESVNEIHRQGFTRDGVSGVSFFKNTANKQSAAELIDLSDAVKSNVNHIATALVPDAPGDNRIALAISGIQHLRLMNDGKTTVDDYYNSIVSDVGVAGAKTREALNQQKDIQTQLGKIREQISGVSIDEETTQLLQYQHAFDASAKVIQIADEMLKTILDIKRT
ncbi:MAG: flagellar hook-associated protein FlgK [Deltaproteobacteria bacterium]|nr:flagellar hook-associated protein FlgK [Deltaproteobacteria bacterium]